MDDLFFIIFLVAGVAILVFAVLGIFKKDKSHFKKAGISAVVMVLSFVGFIATTNSPEEIEAEESKVEEIAGVDETEEKEVEEIAKEEPAKEDIEDEPEPEPEEVEEPTETATREQNNALTSAENYVTIMNFSEEGLRGQLEYEDYPADAINYAIENIVVDYNEQALGAAEQYQEIMPMSDQGLKDQLLYEGYTEEQAQYAIDNLE